MIERQFIGTAFDTAVLATVFVACEDIHSGEFGRAVGFPDPDQIEKPYDGREFDGDRETVNLLIVDFQHFDLALPEKRDGLLPVHNPDRFVCGVEKQGMFHGSIV